MKKIFCIILVFVFITSFSIPAFSEEWNIEDKMLLGGLIVTKFIDYKQTSYIFDHPEEWKELNPLIKSGVDKYGNNFVPFYFLTTTLVEVFIADKLKSEYRGRFVSFLFGASFSTIYFNYQAGIKVNF